MERLEQEGDTLAADVLIVGAGLAGTAAAAVLARRGFSVALVDTHAVYAAEFRAEKLGSPHMALLYRLGLGDTVLEAATPMDDILVYRFGRPVARENRREYGFSYATLINALRDALPAGVQRVTGRVSAVHAGPERQAVMLGDGRRVEARLLVVSTGLGDAVRRAAGIRREEVQRAHSLSLGFCLDGPAGGFPFETLTYFGWKRADRMAYLTLFPIKDAMRANLFVYREPGEAWVKAFRADPQEGLLALAPEIAGLCDRFRVAGPVEVRPVDLIRTEGYRRDGIVLLGDAFCTTCPAPGVGIQRVLNDVDRLCAHLPGWMATPGMGRAKIERYYDDPLKQAMDARGIGLSHYSRAIVTQDGLAWTARRLRNRVVRKALHAAAGALRRLRGGETLAAAAADRLSGDTWRM